MTLIGVLTLMGTLRPKQCRRPNYGHEISTKDPGSQQDTAPHGEGSWVEGVVHPSTLAPSAIPTAESSPEVKPGPPPPSQTLTVASILVPQTHAGHTVSDSLCSPLTEQLRDPLTTQRPPIPQVASQSYLSP